MRQNNLFPLSLYYAAFNIHLRTIYFRIPDLFFFKFALNVCMIGHFCRCAILEFKFHYYVYMASY